ncbi:hypothetical protein HY311_00300 [Candidatus Nomurabacteria bacterium]|nr:hypothetical protein [Candidatus Nomurabacteria bacterium]
MKRFGFMSKWFREMCYGVMEGEQKYLDHKSLEEVMEEIQDLLEACYSLGINPLRPLREILPQYTWKFHRLKNKSKDPRPVAEIVVSSDFIWRLDWYDDMGEDQLVTATKADRVPEHLKWFWTGIERHSRQSRTENIGYIRSVSGNPVDWSNLE